MGDYPATWRCRRSQGSSDGQRCHTVVEIRLTSRTIGSLRLGPAQVSDGSQRQGRQARQASKASEASIVVKPEAATRTEGGARDPVLRHRRAAAPSPAWPRGSPRPHGDAWHCADVRRGTARPLWHDRSLRHRRLGRAPQDRLREQPLAHPTGRDGRTGAACRPGSRPGGSVQLIRAAGSWASWAGPPRSQRAVAVGSTTGLPPSNRPAYAAVGQADRGTCGHVLA